MFFFLLIDYVKLKGLRDLNDYQMLRYICVCKMDQYALKSLNYNIIYNAFIPTYFVLTLILSNLNGYNNHAEYASKFKHLLKQYESI